MHPALDPSKYLTKVWEPILFTICNYELLTFFFLQSTVGIHYKIFLYWRNGKIFCQSFLICWNWFLNIGSKLWTKQALHDRSYLENELDTLNDESWTKVFKWFYKFWWQHHNTKLGYKHFLNGTMYSVVCATKKK